MSTNNKVIPQFTHHFCGSMLPLLRNKDILEIMQVSSVKKGDIVLFQAGEKEQWIAHRVIKIDKEAIYTKGDNNEPVDEKSLYKHDIAGVVTARWRNGRSLKIYRGYVGDIQRRIYYNYFHLRRYTSSIIRQSLFSRKTRKKLKNVLPVPQEVIFVKNGRNVRTLYVGQFYIGTYSDLHDCWQIKFPWRLVY